MVNSDTLHDEEDKEQTSLIKQEQSWTRMEKILLVFGVLMNLGDGVEIYLPGAFIHIYKSELKIRILFIYLSSYRQDHIYLSINRVELLKEINFLELLMTHTSYYSF